MAGRRSGTDQEAQQPAQSSPAEQEPRSKRKRIPTLKAAQQQAESSSSSSPKRRRVTTPIDPPTATSERVLRTKAVSPATTSSPYKRNIKQDSRDADNAHEEDEDDNTRKRNLSLSKNEHSPSSSRHGRTKPIRNPSSPGSIDPVVEISSPRRGESRTSKAQSGPGPPSPSPRGSPARASRSRAVQGAEQGEEEEQVLTAGPLPPTSGAPSNKGKARALDDEGDPSPQAPATASTPSSKSKRKTPSSAQSSQSLKKARAAFNPPVLTPQQVRQSMMGKGTPPSSASPAGATPSFTSGRSARGTATLPGSGASKSSPSQKKQVAVHSEGIPMAATSDRRKKATQTPASAAVTPTKDRLRADLLKGGSATKMVHGSSPLRGASRSASLQKKGGGAQDDESSEDDEALPGTPTGSRDRRRNGDILAQLRGSQNQGLSPLVSPSSSFTRDRTTAALIENSSSDAFFEAHSPSRKSRTTTMSNLSTTPTSTPKHKRQKKRAQLADGLDALDGNDMEIEGRESGKASMSSAAAMKLQSLQDRGTGLEILSQRLGLMRKDTIEGLFPNRNWEEATEGVGDEDDDEDEGDIWEQWKKKWGTVNLPHRPAVVREQAQRGAGLQDDDTASPQGKGKGKAANSRQARQGRHQPSAAGKQTVLIPPFATHTLQALALSHFRGTPSTLVRPDKYQLQASQQDGAGAMNIGDPTSAPNSKFAMWLAQLQAGFSLVFWGVGIGVMPESLAEPPPELFPSSTTNPASGSTKAWSGNGPGSTHLLNTFIQDVCASGHGCAWIGHGLAAQANTAASARNAFTSAAKRGLGPGTSLNGGLKIEDVLNGCEGAVRDAWKYGEDDDDGEAEYELELPALEESSGTSQNQRLEARARRLASLFSGPIMNPDQDEADIDDDEEGQRFDPALHSPAKTEQRRQARALPPALFILIHSLDASPNMVSATAQHILTVLGSASRIHLLGTVRNVNAALAVPFGTGSGAASSVAAGNVAGRGKFSAKTPTESEDGYDDATLEEGRQRRGGRYEDEQVRLRWVWHCISTFVPSLPEAYTARHGALVAGVPAQLDFTGRGGAGPTVAAIRTALGHDQEALAAYTRYHDQLSAASRRRGGGGMGSSDGLPTFAEVEAGLEHVLRSVAPRVRTLFLILAWEQLQTWPAEDGDQDAPQGEGEEGHDGESRGGSGGVTINRIVELGSRAILGLKMTEVQPLLNEFETHHMLEWRHHRSGGDRAASIRLPRAVLKSYLDRLDRGTMGQVNLRVESLEAAKRGQNKKK
ncbi:Origin recognition complex subunit 2 [Tilletia horrida]|uniref:Origin recognition complex subunit 2 n=1 Tax=Tilletia horrida TaxID=155126 RepID=A0AAN6GR68_9BASI|nr:Origin recognition complex subunit 2 [Tilletia horrida]KAK0564516.1 Origin recognition complex subunit 2 [Tilletia horrida]